MCVHDFFVYDFIIIIINDNYGDEIEYKFDF